MAVFLLLLPIAIVGLAAGACDKSWKKLVVEGSGRTKYYSQVSNDADWYAAAKSCHAVGATLPCVESTTENDFISRSFRSANIWLSINRCADENKWVWLGDCSSSFTNWDEGQGVPGDEQCGGMQPQRFSHPRWHDYWCTGGEAKTFSAICECVETASGTPTLAAPELPECSEPPDDPGRWILLVSLIVLVCGGIIGAGIGVCCCWANKCCCWQPKPIPQPMYPQQSYGQAQPTAAVGVIIGQPVNVADVKSTNQ